MHGKNGIIRDPQGTIYHEGAKAQMEDPGYCTDQMKKGNQIQAKTLWRLWTLQPMHNVPRRAHATGIATVVKWTRGEKEQRQDD